MKKTTHYKAEFSTGKVAEINKSTRIYTHAWLFIAQGGWQGAQECVYFGFAGSAELAKKAITSESRFIRGNKKIRYAGDQILPAGRLLHSEVVSVAVVQ